MSKDYLGENRVWAGLAEQAAIKDIWTRYCDDSESIRFNHSTDRIPGGVQKETEFYWKDIHLASVVLIRKQNEWTVLKLEFDLSKQGKQHDNI